MATPTSQDRAARVHVAWSVYVDPPRVPTTSTVLGPGDRVTSGQVYTWSADVFAAPTGTPLTESRTLSAVPYTLTVVVAAVRSVHRALVRCTNGVAVQFALYQ